MYVPAHLASLIHGLPSQHRRHGSGSGTLPAGRGRDTLHPSPSSPGSSPAVTVQPQAGCSGHTHSCLLRERLSFAVLPSRSSPRGTGSMGSLWDLSVPVQGMAGSAQALLNFISQGQTLPRSASWPFPLALAQPGSALTALGRACSAV